VNQNNTPMKKHTINHLFFMFTASVFFLSACGNNTWMLPKELVGQWQSDISSITVRTEPKWMNFKFTTDSSVAFVKIDSNKTASGFIGDAIFTNGKIKKNGGNPEKNGVAYIIQCGHIGKIFSNDPLEKKEVEIWLSPLKGSLHAELRYTEGMSLFPMADLTFRKVK
jgi:hypothetical protein